VAAEREPADNSLDLARLGVALALDDFACSYARVDRV